MKNEKFDPLAWLEGKPLFLDDELPMPGLAVVARTCWHRIPISADHWGDVTAEEDRAFARLLVAAPELLKACETAFAFLEDQGGSPQELAEAWTKTRESLESAICKAKGQDT